MRQRLLRIMGDPPGGVITVTEPEPSSATATAAAFLASVLAEPDPSVVLVDLDLYSAESTQRPVGSGATRRYRGAHRTLHSGGSDGGRLRPADFCGAGRATDSIAELIDSTALRTMIAELRSHYTWVVLACPALTDAAAIADASDMMCWRSAKVSQRTSS